MTTLTQKETTIATATAMETIALIIKMLEEKGGKPVNVADVIAAIKVEGNIQSFFNKVAGMAYGEVMAA